MSYSQNKEDLFVLDYFKGYTGALLSIGENNGTDLQFIIDRNKGGISA